MRNPVAPGGKTVNPTTRRRQLQTPRLTTPTPILPKLYLNLPTFLPTYIPHHTTPTKCPTPLRAQKAKESADAPQPPTPKTSGADDSAAASAREEMATARESDTTTTTRIRCAALTDQTRRAHRNQLPNAAALGVRGMESPPADTVMDGTMAGGNIDTATARATKIRNLDPHAVTAIAARNTDPRALEAATAIATLIAIRDLYPTHHPRRCGRATRPSRVSRIVSP